jgi:hypothetical protein
MNFDDDIFVIEDTKELKTKEDIEEQIALTIGKEIKKELAFASIAIDESGIRDVNYFSSNTSPSSIELIAKLRNEFLPNGRIPVTVEAYNWYDKDDLLCGMINIIIDFCMSGFNLTGLETNEMSFNLIKMSDEENIEHDKDVAILQDELNKFDLEFGFNKVIEQMSKDYLISDSMILYWCVNSVTGKLVEVNALDPRTVDWDNSFGRDVLTIVIPDELYNRIRSAVTKKGRDRDKSINQLLEEGVIQKMIDAVSNGIRTIRLDNEDGDYWLIETKARKHCGLAIPSMKSIFLPLAIRLIMTEGDFSAAVMMKHFVMHIQQGETLEHGPAAGTKEHWITQDTADALVAKFKGVNKATVIATDHTVKISFVFPPKEMFEFGRYAKSESRISGFYGVTRTIYDGTEGEYGGAYISIRRLISRINSLRDKIDTLVKLFFMSDSMNGQINIPEGIYIGVNFDTQYLKEPRLVLQEVQALLKEHSMDPETALSELGRDPARIKRSRRNAIRENEELETWKPLNANEKGSDNIRDGMGRGRDPNPETELNEDTRSQYPNASAN